MFTRPIYRFAAVAILTLTLLFPGVWNAGSSAFAAPEEAITLDFKDIELSLISSRPSVNSRGRTLSMTRVCAARPPSYPPSP